MSGTRAPKAQAMMGGGGPARAEQRQPPGGTSTAAAGSLTSTLLGVPSTAGSQRRRPNARWAAVGEASEASRDADVTPRQNDQETHKEWGRPTSQIGLEGLLELDQRSLARTVL